MTVLLSWDGADVALWSSTFEELLEGQEFRIYPDIGNPEDITHAVVWMHPVGDLKNYPNLKAIHSIGAGVSHILRDPELPDVPIVRLVGDTIKNDMSAHILFWVIGFHRHYFQYAKDQTEQVWNRVPYPPNGNVTVGILGLGTLGVEASKHLNALGYNVIGWSRKPKEIDNVLGFSGADGLNEVLSKSSILINLLPHTIETKGILNKDALSQMPKGGYLINCGRGEAIVDDDLIKQLDDGHLSAAALDVFDQEPLPKEHPFWEHPKIHITPHAAAPSDQSASAYTVATNIMKFEDGDMSLPIADSKRGY